jgi:hypothetical protein
MYEGLQNLTYFARSAGTKMEVCDGRLVATGVTADALHDREAEVVSYLTNFAVLETIEGLEDEKIWVIREEVPKGAKQMRKHAAQGVVRWGTLKKKEVQK